MAANGARIGWMAGGQLALGVLGFGAAPFVGRDARQRQQNAPAGLEQQMAQMMAPRPVRAAFQGVGHGLNPQAWERPRMEPIRNLGVVAQAAFPVLRGAVRHHDVIREGARQVGERFPEHVDAGGALLQNRAAVQGMQMGINAGIGIAAGAAAARFAPRIPGPPLLRAAFVAMPALYMGAASLGGVGRNVNAAGNAVAPLADMIRRARG